MGASKMESREGEHLQRGMSIKRFTEIGNVIERIKSEQRGPGVNSAGESRMSSGQDREKGNDEQKGSGSTGENGQGVKSRANGGEVVLD